MGKMILASWDLLCKLSKKLDSFCNGVLFSNILKKQKSPLSPDYFATYKDILKHLGLGCKQATFSLIVLSKSFPKYHFFVYLFLNYIFSCFEQDCLAFHYKRFLSIFYNEWIAVGFIRNFRVCHFPLHFSFLPSAEIPTYLLGIKSSGCL